MNLPEELEAKLHKLNQFSIDEDLAEIKQQAEVWAREEEKKAKAETEEDEQLAPISDIEKLRPKFAKAAQEFYDAWEVVEDGYDAEVGVGGICHLIADAIPEVLPQELPYTSVSSDHKVHVWVAVLAEDGVYRIDIPHGLYETGGGYSWEKIPDITFDDQDLVIDQINHTNKWVNYKQTF